MAGLLNRGLSSLVLVDSLYTWRAALLLGQDDDEVARFPSLARLTLSCLQYRSMSSHHRATCLSLVSLTGCSLRRPGG